MSSSLSLLILLCALAATTHAGLKVNNLRAKKLPSFIGTTDAYVKVTCGAAELGETVPRYNNANPWWDEEFNHFQAQPSDVLKLEVFDHDIGLDDLLGTCQRTIQVGTWTNLECYLNRGGTLYYSYTYTK